VPKNLLTHLRRLDTCSRRETTAGRLGLDSALDVDDAAETWFVMAPDVDDVQGASIAFNVVFLTTAA